MKWNVPLVLTAILGLMISTADASPDQVKVYKAAFPSSKPKCSFCHIDNVPKKEAGQHDLNAYGLKARALNKKPTTEDYKTIGAYEETK